ncbi:MAG TPA: 2-oxoglutarate dehydrogenase complex dihydrolipoyllysine-residue succinyltransferase [Candidatus Binatia bacterium]
MAFEVRIPSLGESVSEAVIGRWIKQDGELVQADEPILELESDKANMDLAAEQSGRLKVLKKAGETVQEGDVVAVIEPAEGAAAGATEPAQAAPEAAKPAPAAAATSTESKPAPAAAPSTSARPTEQALSVASAKPAAEQPLSPAVRRIVAEENLDVSGVEGTGPHGRLTKADVLELAEQRKSKVTPISAPAASATSASSGAAAASAPSASAARAAAPARAPRPELGDEAQLEERVPMSRMRQVIARRLVEAQHTAAILTTFNEADMSAIIELRTRYKEAFQKKHGVGLGFMSFFVAACCHAAREVPELNAEIQGNEIVYRRYVHMGVAVGTERGLVVPVVRNADRLSFAEIEREIARLAELARAGKLSVDDLSGATFTISNGGVYGSLLSTPILNPPQSGILGMHKIEKRPVVVDDQIVVRPMMYLALSYDHRIVDGQGAVTFLVRVKEALEDPTRLLLGL